MIDTSQNIDHREGGFTIIELLVSILMFAIVSAGLAQAMGNVFQTLGSESRLASAIQTARLAMSTVSTELRMASVVSPYLPGNDPALVTCAANFTATATSVTFLVVHDSTTGGNGLDSKFVGYEYDAVNSALRRGEVSSASSSSCAVPAADPLAAGNSSPIALNVVQVDYDDNGTDEPIFSVSGNTLTITYGVSVLGSDKQQKVQKFQTSILLRNHIV